MTDDIEPTETKNPESAEPGPEADPEEQQTITITEPTLIVPEEDQ